MSGALGITLTFRHSYCRRISTDFGEAMADHPLWVAAANLWRRRWTLALLLVLMSLVLEALARMTSPVNAAIIHNLHILDAWRFLRPPLPHVVITAVLFSYFWFRVCLLRQPDVRDVGGDLRCLLGRSHDAMRFAAYAAVLLALTGLVYLVSMAAVHWLFHAGLGWPVLWAEVFLGRAGTTMLFGFLTCAPLAFLAPVLVSGTLALASAAIGGPLSFAGARRLVDMGHRRSAKLLVLAFGLLLSIPITQLITLFMARGRLSDLPVNLDAVYMAISALRIASTLIAVAILVELVCRLYRNVVQEGVPEAPKPV